MVDIPNITQQIVANATSTSAKPPQLLALEEALGARVGQRIQALVQQTTPLTLAEKVFLARPSASDSAAIAPGQTSTPTRPTLNLQTTQLLELAVNGKTLSALSDLPIQRQQTVNIVLQASGRVIILELPQQQPPLTTKPNNSLQPPPNQQTVAQNSATAQAPTSKAKASTQISAAAASHRPIKGHEPTQPRPDHSPQPRTVPSSRVTVGTLVQPGTKEPKAAQVESAKLSTQLTPTNTNSTTVKTNTQATNNVPFKAVRARAAYQQPQIALPSLSKLPTVLLDEISQLPKGKQPTQLFNSAASLPTRLPIVSKDHPLAQVVQTLRHLTQLVQSQPSQQALLQSPDATIKRATENSGVFYEHKLSQATSQPNTPDVAQDMKFQLQNLLNGLDVSTQLLKLPPSNEHKQLFEQLLQLFNKAAPNQTPNTNTSNAIQNWRAEVSNTLQQLQAMQYRTIANALLEPNTPTQTFFTEFPVRLFHGLGHAFFQWDTPPPKKKKAKTAKNTNKPEQKWRVYMEFEAQDVLAVELNVSEHTMKGDLWASGDTLREETKENLHSLKNKLEACGLTVTDLRCHQAPPPQKPMTLDCSSIAVKT